MHILAALPVATRAYGAKLKLTDLEVTPLRRATRYMIPDNTYSGCTFITKEIWRCGDYVPWYDKMLSMTNREEWSDLGSIARCSLAGHNDNRTSHGMTWRTWTTTVQNSETSAQAARAVRKAIASRLVARAHDSAEASFRKRGSVPQWWQPLGLRQCNTS